MALTTAEMAALRYTRLLALAAPAMVNEAAQPLAALADVAILGTAGKPIQQREVTETAEDKDEER